ncbi:cytochrome P450 1A1-like [Tubulanus polymorphus]|uniref:cytochrome P450 1A1-like n=1 Tax=Tubulanus polymorphus TaxID=672921 RepID=UPI003DA2C14F
MSVAVAVMSLFSDWDYLQFINVFLLFFGSYILWWTYNEYFRWYLPPGPWGLPIIGHVLALGENPHLTFMKMRAKYGDVFRIRLGSFPTIVVNGDESIREVTNARLGGDDFAGRPRFYLFTLRDDGLSVGRYDESWRQMKNVAVKSLHRFVNENDEDFDDLLTDEAERLVNAISRHDERPFSPKTLMIMTTGSVTYQLCYGRGHDLNGDEVFNRIMDGAREFFEFASAGNPVDVMPWLRYFMPWKTNAIREAMSFADEISKEILANHEETFSANHTRDILDSYLALDYDKLSGIDKTRLGYTCYEFLTAGFETTSTVSLWTMLYMIKHPDVQQKIYDEISDIVGDSRLPRISDKSKLPFLEATITEVMRIRTPGTLALPHAAVRDSKIGGFDVPEGTVVLLNLYSLAQDENVWEDPHVFRPERFLTADGQIDRSKRNLILPFSAGPRKCPGENLAKFELFVFLASILQKFEILPVPDVEYDMTPIHGLTDCPQIFDIIAKHRK